MNTLLCAVPFVHQILDSHIRPGDWALDATCGNGHDTLFLAQRVAPKGRVIALDLQEIALEITRTRLEEAALLESVSLHRKNHDQLSAILQAEGAPLLSTAMFNLGYLPGSDKTVITESETTLCACRLARDQLRPGGILSIITYAGHPGGKEEHEVIQNWIASPENAENRSLSYHLSHHHSHAFLLEKG